MSRKSARIHLFILTLLLLGGCAAKPPPSISKVPPDNPSLMRVRMDIDRFVGAEVRWGGVISRVENKSASTWIELVRRQLREDGRPMTGDSSDGRFIASFSGFIDPLDYKAGSLLTVVGTIEGKVKRPIGEFEYTFPIVTVEGSHLWKVERTVQRAYYPPPWYYYDMHFYRPFPYHRHPPFH